MASHAPQPQRDRATPRRRDQQAQKTRLEKEIQAFFRQTGVRTVNLDDMFQELEWPA